MQAGTSTKVCYLWRVNRIFLRLLVLVQLGLQLLSSGLSAQVHGDSLVVYRPEKFHKYEVNLDNRNSFLGPDPISLYGLKAGITVRHRWRFGVCYHQLLQPQNINFTWLNQSYQAKLGFYYGGVFAEWICLHRKFLEVSIPVSYEIGMAPILSSNGMALPESSKYTDLQLAEITVNGYYKIFDWIGPGIGTGYRFMLNGNDFIKRNFSAPIFVIKIQIFLDPLYYDLFPKGIRPKEE